MGQAASQQGWRVLKIHALGPCGKTDLVPFMDYIVAADGVPVSSEEETFVSTIKRHAAAQSSMTMTVYNLLSGLQRDIFVQPSGAWGGEGLLGLVIRFDTMKQAEEHCVHILDVHANSPAHRAGLIAHEDYLLGTHDTVIKSYGDLEQLLAKFNGHSVTLVVFNTINRGVREVVLQPKAGWGGAGVLGCNIGHGWLHRLPLQTAAAVAAAQSEQLSEPIQIEIDDTGTLSFLISVLVQGTDQMITLPVVIFPTDISLYEYNAYSALTSASAVADGVTSPSPSPLATPSSSSSTSSSTPAYYATDAAPIQSAPVPVAQPPVAPAVPPPSQLPPHSYAFPHPRTASLSQPLPFVPLSQQQHHTPSATAAAALPPPPHRQYWTPPQPSSTANAQLP